MSEAAENSAMRLRAGPAGDPAASCAPPVAARRARPFRTRGHALALARIPILAALLALAAMLAAPLGASRPATAAPAPTEGAAPPYDADLLRLAEILGSLHYLRPLCGVSAEAQRWRSEMQAVIDTEQPSEARKGKMIAAFNRGYSSFAQAYRTCTPAAQYAIDRHIEEGARLAHDIVVRFGGN